MCRLLSVRECGLYRTYQARRRLHLMDVPLVGSVLASIAKTGVSSPVLCSRAVSKLKQTAPEDIDSATKERGGQQRCAGCLAGQFWMGSPQTSEKAGPKSEGGAPNP